uniref:Si:dkey-17e16.9 n=1 Tax=Oryzias latipes TaxID=8090 RepID=A0A3P9KNF0_ORYLA
MAEYKLSVTTGGMRHAGTLDNIFIILFGTEGQSERTRLDNSGIDFKSGTTRTYSLKCSFSLGKLLQLKVEKDSFLHLLDDRWYCCKVEVMTPEGEEIAFPCFRWISSGEEVELRGGKVFEEEHPLLIDHRNKELKLRKSLYHCPATFTSQIYRSSQLRCSSLSSDQMKYIIQKEKCEEFTRDLLRLFGVVCFVSLVFIFRNTELMFKGLAGSCKEWKSIEDLEKVFKSRKTSMSEYVSKHWKEDDFFGYQFLNGTNPNAIKRCSKLPPNFPVTEEMVKPCLPNGFTLKEEMEKGNIFLCDQRIMEGIPTRVKDGNPLHMTAGLCLFYMNPEGKLMPLAIQLNQKASAENPIFLPTDPEKDWLLAKLFFKSADLLECEVVHHLLITHFLSEVFAVATLRCFPTIHPLHKLLIPHFRFTLHINIMGREALLGPDGALCASSFGLEGLMELMGRGLSETTYSALCLPENITARGLDSIPNFYYRDDALKLWDVIESFVRSVVKDHYPSADAVFKDTELQEWIDEIFTQGFLENKQSGVPASFHTVEEVVKFVTMVIFTVSVQHAAVNNGQFDFHSWIPNGSLQLQKPPPTSKGQSRMNTFLQALPNVGDSVKFAAMFWMLSDKYTDMVPLGAFPEERFSEPHLKQMIKDFQAELSYLSEEISLRNSKLQVPYAYLNPKQIENSVAV